MYMNLNRNMLRRLAAAALAGTMVFSLAACGSKGGSSSSASTSSSSSSSTSSSSAQDDDAKTQQADVLSAILVDIKGNVEVGSAGSSLKAVPYAVSLLDWASSSTLSQDEITAIVNEMLNTVSGDESAADEYNEQLGLVNADCQVLLSDDAQDHFADLLLVAAAGVGDLGEGSGVDVQGGHVADDLVGVDLGHIVIDLPSSLGQNALGLDYTMSTVLVAFQLCHNIFPPK